MIMKKYIVTFSADSDYDSITISNWLESNEDYECLGDIHYISSSMSRSEIQKLLESFLENGCGEIIVSRYKISDSETTPD